MQAKRKTATDARAKHEGYLRTACVSVSPHISLRGFQ
ncbi:hypothetical protein V6N11_034840, partial [Hibiscus sabdariffa]